MTAALLARADAYASDAAYLRQTGHLDDAVIYETVAAELRKVAAEVTA